MEFKEKSMENIEKIKNSIREIPNFPKEGILFRDITTALKDAEILKLMIDEVKSFLNTLVSRFETIERCL